MQEPAGLSEEQGSPLGYPEELRKQQRDQRIDYAVMLYVYYRFIRIYSKISRRRASTRKPVDRNDTFLEVAVDALRDSWAESKVVIPQFARETWRMLLRRWVIEFIAWATKNYLFRLAVRACVSIDERDRRDRRPVDIRVFRRFFPVEFKGNIKAVNWLLWMFVDLNGSVAGLKLRGIDLSGSFLEGINLAEVDLSEANLTSTCLGKANLARANFHNAILTGADLRGADLSNANFQGADLANAFLDGALIKQCDLRAANLQYSSLVGVRFIKSDLRHADLSSSDLRQADLVESDLGSTNLQGTSIYGISAWGLRGAPANSKDLVITPPDEPRVVVDDLEVAQLIYLLLYDTKIRTVIDAVTSSTVLILGNFADERKRVLEAIRCELRFHGYTPVLFDFKEPANRNITETVNLLCHLARFVIADITDAIEVRHELGVNALALTSVPVQPILRKGSDEYSTFNSLAEDRGWVLSVFEYHDEEDLLGSLKCAVIEPAEKRLAMKKKRKEGRLDMQKRDDSV